MAYKKNKSSKVAYQREKYIQKRMSQLEKLGFTKEEILGRAKDESSFWSSKRNYDSFRKRANQMAKGLRQEEKRINQEIERRVSLIDESKIKSVSGYRGYTIDKELVKQAMISNIKLDVYSQEFANRTYDSSTKKFLEEHIKLFDRTPVDYTKRTPDKLKQEIKAINSLNYYSDRYYVNRERQLLENLFSNGKMGDIDERIHNRLIETIRSADITQIVELYEEYSRDEILMDYQFWRMVEDVAFTRSELESKAEWVIAKLSS